MKLTTKNLVLTGVFAAIATVLMYIETPLPIFPSFLKIDLSTVVTLIAGYVISPVCAVFVALIKDLIHLISTQTGGIGELADFLMSTAMVFTATALRKKLIQYMGEIKATVIGLVAGSLAATFIALLSNYFLLIPFYEKFMPLQAIIDMANDVIPVINNKFTLIMFAFLPFNLLKTLLISVLAFLLERRIKNISVFKL